MKCVYFKDSDWDQFLKQSAKQAKKLNDKVQAMVLKAKETKAKRRAEQLTQQIN